MKSQLKDVLNKVHLGKLSPEEAFLALKDYPYQNLGFAKIDHHRELRKGFPEIIFGLGVIGFGVAAWVLRKRDS